MASSGTAGGPAGKPAGSNMTNQLVMLMAFMFAIFILFNPSIRQGLGEIVGYGLEPVVGFNGEYPIVTLLLSGLVMTCFSISVRHFFIDWVGQARNQRIQSAFSKEMREARTSNNTYKLKKLMELQPQIMSASLKTTQSQFKLMPITMLVIIPIFAWLANFVYIGLGSTVFSVPWEFNSNMRNSNLLPNWVLLYSLMTLPFGQVLQRFLKMFSFGRRLKELETEGIATPHDDRFRQ
ncbi:MAG: EMC3/TMCO1 family protein [Thermoplasmata archaeon]|nr:EMC3/TMCO1 family protein [Thermoplasmata archaeon]